MKFADTSWWAALVLPSDGRHRDATEMRKLIRGGERVLTTNLVVGETWTLLRRRANHIAAVGFLDRVNVLVSDYSHGWLAEEVVGGGADYLVDY